MALTLRVYVPGVTFANVKTPFPLVAVVRPPGLSETVAPEIGRPVRLATTVPVTTPGPGVGVGVGVIGLDAESFAKFGGCGVFVVGLSEH